MNKYGFELSQVVVYIYTDSFVYIYTDSALKFVFPLSLLSFTSSGNFLKSVSLELKAKNNILQNFYHTY